MLTMTRRLEFDAGHRLLNHEAKCAHVHGHRYVVEVTLDLTGELDRAGRIVDFGDVKRVFGGWIDDTLDHGFIANADDPIVGFLREHGQRHVAVPFEPSAENLAVWMLGRAAGMLDAPGRRVTSLVVHETPNGLAEARR